jgi:pyruvate dehydrogenase E1 component beta subunit
MTAREIKYSEAILEATRQMMLQDDKVVLMGLGVSDPGGIFGTTKGLVDEFGAGRVIETPTAENGMMGVAIGSSLVGMKPIITHQRVEFSLLAYEQIVNQAAKWNYMTAGKKSVPIVLRLIIGRGWGQGPQHSQSLDPIFAHVPGLKVISPFSPSDAKGLLAAAINDPNPVIMLEHRWLHQTYGEVRSDLYLQKIGCSKIVHAGTDITIVTYSYMVIEALRVAKELAKIGISAEVIDLTSLRPLDFKTIESSIEKTGKLLTIDNGWSTYGIGAEIVARAATECFNSLREPPIRLGISDVPIPSTRALANLVYPGFNRVVDAVSEILRRDLSSLKKKSICVEDVPDKSFTGPF